MKLGIIGLPGSGKTTLFNALTGKTAEVSFYQGGKREPNLAAVDVPDGRLERLTELYLPKKTIPAKVQYVDIAGTVGVKEGEEASLDALLTLLRPADALVHVVRNFERVGEPPNPQRDADELEADLVLTDLLSVEKRVERLTKEVKKGKRGDPEELALLEGAKTILETGEALRAHPQLAEAPKLSGYAFLSAKPTIVVLNSGDELTLGATPLHLPPGVRLIEIKGRLEMELSQLPPEEAEFFRADLGLSERATNQLIRESYALLGLVSFFTVGPDEVRAWTVRSDTPARHAAGTVHSDMEKGFIRAEVVAYSDLIACSTYAEAQKAGRVRLEGKEYPVKDGDIIDFRFNV